MGIQNATARRLAVPDLTTTVLTLTLTGLAADSAPGRRTGRPSPSASPDRGRRERRRFLLGALLVLHAGATAALGLAVGLLAVVTAGATLAARRPGSWRAGQPAEHWSG